MELARTWSIVLTDDAEGVPPGRRLALTGRALERAALVGGPRTTLVSLAQSRLCDVPAMGLDPKIHLGVRPREAGTGLAVALALLMIEREAPDAIVALMPERLVVSDDLRLVSHVRYAMSWLETQPDGLVTLAVPADEPSHAHRWVVPKDAGEPLPLAFVPARLAHPRRGGEALRLREQGAWWDTGVSVFRLRTALALYEARTPGFLEVAHGALHGGWDAVETLFEEKAGVDFHRDVLGEGEAQLHALHARNLHLRSEREAAVPEPVAGWRSAG